jgi:hypothetical protein
MGAEPPRLEDQAQHRRSARLGLWYAAAGIIVGVAAAICFANSCISLPQAIALALPAALLAIVGLAAAAAPDTATGRRRIFAAGYLAGSLLSRWRSSFRQRRARR